MMKMRKKQTVILFIVENKCFPLNVVQNTRILQQRYPDTNVKGNKSGNFIKFTIVT